MWAGLPEVEDEGGIAGPELGVDSTPGGSPRRSESGDSLHGIDSHAAVEFLGPDVHEVDAPVVGANNSHGAGAPPDPPVLADEGHNAPRSNAVVVDSPYAILLRYFRNFNLTQKNKSLRNLISVTPQI